VCTVCIKHRYQEHFSYSNFSMVVTQFRFLLYVSSFKEKCKNCQELHDMSYIIQCGDFLRFFFVFNKQLPKYSSPGLCHETA
jgi:hypothetical protein